MLAYVARRLALAVGTVFAAVLITFLLVHATGGSPGAVRLGPGATRRRSPRRTRSLVGTDRYTCSSSTTWDRWFRAIWGHR